MRISVWVQGVGTTRGSVVHTCPVYMITQLSNGKYVFCIRSHQLSVFPAEDQSTSMLSDFDIHSLGSLAGLQGRVFNTVRLAIREGH